MKSKGRFAAAGISGLFAGVLILLLRLVDVRAIGPEGTSIGLSHLNHYVFQLFGVNILFYSITDWLGIAAVLTAALFAAVGFVQMVRRRSVLKVDREILALGGLYILVIGLYVLFEVMIVNYRPIIMPGCTRPEASFPSSHTMLICVIMGSTMMLIDRYVKGQAASGVLRAGCAAVIGITVIGRLISGVHWFTDIVGGILISAMLLNLYAGVLQRFQRNMGEKMILESRRLRIRIASQKEMTEFIEKETDDVLKTAYQEMLQGCMEHPEQWEWYAIWMIESKDGEHIGDLSFKGLGPDGAVEIGYGISEAHQGNGFAAEAVGAAVNWALEQPGIRCVEAETDPDNRASQRVLEKCGFLPTGVIGEEGPRFIRTNG